MMHTVANTPKARQTPGTHRRSRPVGLTAAIELTRRGIDCNRRSGAGAACSTQKPLVYNHVRSKIFEAMGVLRILDAAIRMHLLGWLRLFSLLGPGHHPAAVRRNDTGPTDIKRFERTAEAAVAAADGEVNVYLMALSRRRYCRSSATPRPIAQQRARPTSEPPSSSGPTGTSVSADNDAALTA